MEVKLKCGATLEWDERNRSTVIKATIPSSLGMRVDSVHDDGRGVESATICINHHEDFITIAQFLLAVRDLQQRRQQDLRREAQRDEG